MTSVAKDNLLYDRKGFGSRTKGFRESVLSPTLLTMMGTGGNNVPMVLQKSQDGIREYNEVMSTLRKEMGDNMPIVNNPIKNYKEGGDTAVTLSATSWKGYGNDGTNIYNSSGNLRRLTPKECFRLMGFLNDEIKLEGISDSQRYKLAGNGWEITVASKILKNMLSEATKEGDGK